jgi:putative oxidoreductase
MLRRAEPPLFVALRVVTGLMLALHGSQRLVGFPPGERATEPLRIAACAIELTAGSLVAFGLFTTWAALVAGVTMVIGFALRRTELLALDALLFLWIACRAAGRKLKIEN